MNVENLQRAFIHEIGHYSARILNLNLYDKGTGVSQISLKEEKLNGELEYVGAIYSKKPKGYVDQNQIMDKPQFATVQIYGCLFQYLYESKIKKNGFKECFTSNWDKSELNRAHGKCDYINLNSNLGSQNRYDIITFVEQDYLKILKENIEHFNEVFDLKVLDFIKSPSKLMYIDLEKLNLGISDFLAEHEKYYSQIIERISELIKKNER